MTEKNYIFRIENYDPRDDEEIMFKSDREALKYMEDNFDVYRMVVDFCIQLDDKQLEEVVNYKGDIVYYIAVYREEYYRGHCRDLEYVGKSTEISVRDVLKDLEFIA